MIVLSPEYIVPDSGNPIVESTDITEEPTLTFSKTFDEGVIWKFPCTELFSSNPTNKETLKNCFWFLVNDSTADIDAFTKASVVFVKVWPTSFVGSPEITSATHTSLLMKFASEGFVT